MDVEEAARVIELPAPDCWPGFAALATADNEPSLELLVGQLASHDWTRRRAAVKALGEHPRGKVATRAVRDRLSDPSPFVVRAAAEAVTAIGDRAGRPSLIALLDDPEAATRMAGLRALDGLWESGDADRVMATAQGDRSADVRKEASWVLRNHASADTWEALYDLWCHSSLPRERAWAIHVAAEFGGAAVSERIRALLSDSDGHVRSAASRALKEPRDR
jgi:HEAT repeat protein